MADETAVTRLIYDATGARQGAAEFRSASQSIIDDNRRVEEALARSAATLTAAQGKKAGAHKTAATAATEGSAAEIAAAHKSADAIAQAARRGDSFSSRLGNVSINEVRGAQSSLSRLPAAQISRSYEERLAALEAGMTGRAAPRFAATAASSLQGPAAAITPAALGPLVSSAFGTIRAGDPLVARGVRNVALTEATDPVAVRALGQIHNAAANSGAGIGAPTLPGQIGAASAAVGCDCHALTVAIEQLSLSVNKLQVQLAAAPAAARQAAAAARPLAPVVPAGVVARRADTAAASDEAGPWLVEQVVPRSLSASGLAAAGRDLQRQVALEQRAAYGFVTAAQPAFVTPASIRSLGSGEDIVSGVAAARDASIRAPAAPAGGIDVGQWLKARQPPNEVDATAWIKARQGPESFLGSLKNLFPFARSGAADLHAASAAAEELATASEHAAGAGGRMREGFVILREIFRGDFTRLVGSTTIELQRFGLLGALFNPITLGAAAAVGALGYLAYKSSEIEANLRSFGTTVKVMGDGSLTSAAELEKFTEELKHTGVAGADAKKTIDEISRAGFVRPGQATADFASLARDISQYQGTGAKGTPAAAEELLKAFSGDVDGAIKYAESLNALRGPQIAAIHDLDQHAKSAEAFQKVYAAIRAAMPPFIGDLSELQKAFLGIDTAWDKFTTSLAKSEFPSHVTSFIEEGIKRLQTTIDELEKAANFIRTGSINKAGVTGSYTGPGIPRDQIAPEYGSGSGNLEPYASAALPSRPLTGGAEVKQADFLNYAGTLGFTPSQSAALAGQARAESTFNTGAGLGTAHQGLFQWDADRWGQMLAWAQLNGLDPMDYRTQLQFSKKEIQTKAPEFFTASTLGEQTSILTKKFEVSGNYDKEIPNRLGFAEQALGTSTTPFRPTEPQTAAIDLQNQKLKEQLGISSQIAGVDREATEERIRLQQEAAKNPLGDQKKFIDEGMIGFFRNRQVLFDSQHRLNEIEISDTDKIAAAYQKSAVEGLRAETLIQAQKQIREQGGAPEEVATAQRDIINQRAAAAIAASRQQSILAEPGIAGAEALARASLVSRAEEEKTRIVTEAAIQTHNVLNLALLQDSEAYKKEAAAIDENARSQIRRRDAAAQGLEAGHQIQANQDQSRVLALEVGLQGEGSNAIRTQVDLLRARQEIEQRYTALTQDQRDAIFASTAGVIQQNAALVQAQEATARINDAFRSLTSTIDGDLTNSIRNALTRTPAEAGEHLKHYWDDFRAGLRSVAGEIASTFAKLAFIKPLTGTIAGALGLGQTAQQLGTFGGLFQGGGTPSPNLATPGTHVTPASATFSDAQLALNVSGISNGGGIFNASQNGYVFGPGSTTTVQGAAQAIAGSGEAAPAGIGTAGLSADQLQAILNAQPTPLGAQSNAAPILETFLGTITSAAATGTQQSLAAAATAAGAPTTLIIPGVQNPVIPAGSLAPELVAAPELPLTTGVETPGATSPVAAATGSLATPGNIGGAVSGLTALGSLLSQPGLLPSWLSGTGGAGGLFGAGGLSGAINSVSLGGLFATQIPAGEAITQGLGPLAANAAGNVTVPGSLFGSTATLGSALTGVAAGFGAGSLLNSVLGGNQLTGNIGAGAGSLVGSLIGSIVPGIGTLIGGIVGGAAGGGIGGLFGAPPSGQSAGVTIGAGGAQTFEQAGGSAANIQASNQVAGQISSFVQQLGQLTDAQGKAIGTIDSGLIAVQSNNRQGIVVSGGNIAGGQFGQNAQNAVVQTELQIINSLTNVSGSLQTILGHLTDPGQLQAAVQFADVYDKLNVTSQQLTASLTGNTNQIGPFSQALTQINSTFSQLTAQATQFGVSTAPITTALNVVTQTLHQDFAINIAEALSTAIAGGNDFIAALIKIHQQFVQNTNDAQALATGVPTGSTPGFAGGTMGGVTPPGWILVGERGPEWMLQPGGSTVLPNGVQPPDAPDPLGRSFAQGIGAGDVAGQVPGIGSLISQSAGGPSLLDAAGGVLGISSDTLSAIGSALPIAGPILGGLLGAATGHPVQGAIGAASSLLGFAVGGPVGGVIGGLVGLIGNVIGPPPSNRASGDLIDLASGAISDFQSAGDSKADQIVQGISSGIAASSQLLQQVTGGSISGAVNVQDGARDGIKTSYSGPQGNIDAKWSSADEAIGQWSLAIAHNLVGIDAGLQSALAAVSDPTQLIPVINAYVAAHAPAAAAPAAAAASTPAPADSGQSHEYASLPVPQELSDTYSREIQGIAGGAVTLPEIQDLAAGIAADAVSPSQLSDIQAMLPTLTQTTPDMASILSAAIPSYAAGTGSGTTPPGWILVGEKGPEWISQPGGATVLPNGVMPPAGASPAGRSFAAGSVSADVTSAITGTEVAQAGPILAALGIDQLTTVIQNLAIVAPEIAQMAQDLITSGNALPDILTQGIQALTDPLDLAIEKEKAAGQERVAIATQTGQDLVKVEQLNSANIVSAVISNLSNQSSLAALQFPGNTQALETIQAAPVLAGLSGDQLTALISDISGVAPDLAALAQQQISGGTALPDTVTQALQAIVNPLQLALEQQGAQATGRTQVAAATGLYGPQTAALNTASISQAIVQQLGNQQAILALTANGNPQGLAALQAAPTLAGLGIDQLQKVATDLGNAAPQFTAMIDALIQSGKALPDALSQASESITQSGLLAVQKAQALAFEQYQAAQASGQNLPEAQQLGAAEQAQAVAQATGTQIPVFGLPDFGTQLEEAVVNPLQLAVQKAEALGQQEIQIAQQTGTDLVQVQRATSESIQQIWYQATSSLTDLKNQITGGTLSGLIPADQVTASITQFNTLLKLVQGGNTNFISQLSSAGQAAVTASQQAYGQGPQTASVRQQVLNAISPFLVSASGYPTTGATALDATAASLTATGSTTDLQANTTALGALTDALTGVTTAVTTGTTSATNLTAAGSTTAGITTNPVTGGAFTGSGITAITPNFPVFPSASTLSNSLSDAISGIGSGADYTAINEAVQAGIINAAEMPQYASAITAASQYAAGQTVAPSQPLAQALSDALTGTPTLAEWGTIITAVNADLINPVSDPKYATVIQRARIVANAQATSLAQTPNTATAFATTYKGLPAFAAGIASTPPGPILVGEQGPEIIYQPGGMSVLPHGAMRDLASMPAFSDGTLPVSAFELPSQGSSDSVLAPGNERLLRALLMQVQAGNKQAMDDAHLTNAHLNEIRQGVQPGIRAPERRAVG